MSPSLTSPVLIEERMRPVGCRECCEFTSLLNLSFIYPQRFSVGTRCTKNITENCCFIPVRVSIYVVVVLVVVVVVVVVVYVVVAVVRPHCMQRCGLLLPMFCVVCLSVSVCVC